MFGRKRPAFRTRITEDEFSGFRLTIPMKRHWLRIAVLATMLFGWAVLELVCMALLVNGPVLHEPGRPAVSFSSEPGARLVFLLMSLYWTIAGFLFAYVLCWNVAGRELITISDGRLGLETWAASAHWRRGFNLDDVRSLRYDPPAYGNPFTRPGGPMWNAWLYGVHPGVLAFDYLGQTFRFGRDLSEPEARRLCAILRSRFKIIDGPADRR